MRVRLLERLDPHWKCASCSHGKFFVDPDFAGMHRLSSSATGLTAERLAPCLPLICMRCGFVSLHSVVVLSGELDEWLASNAEGG